MATLTAEEDTMPNYVAFSDGLKTGNPITDEFVGVVPQAPVEPEPEPAPVQVAEPVTPAVVRAAVPAQPAQPAATAEAVAEATRPARGAVSEKPTTRRRRPGRRIKDEPCRVEVHIDGSAYSVDLPVGSIDEGLATLRVIDVLGHAERRLDGEHRRPPTQISELHNRARRWAQRRGMGVGNRGPVSWAMVKDYLAAQVPAVAD